ncbi:response regulator transcription factor [Marmoricola sp. URHB0036]|uniref:response regulator transcription factor n=1 Tax=Marmoricola sp. URHB0036 TaxID=1298863 RepID=UPI000485B79C|nr:response regulator transcription factor [Marmoricola sp. URHB0036]
MTRVGVVEDDASVRRVLSDALRMNGHEVVIARNGQEALRNLTPSSGVDVLVIDIGLPDADGRDVCQALRTEGQHAPVLFLTALDAVHDRVSGFHAGGDDYVPKPFALSEVLVRIEALHRRSRPLPTEVTGLHLDPDRYAVRHGELEQRLTPTEFRMLAAIAAQPGTVVRRRAAVLAGWPEGAMVSENTIDSYIRRLRVKLAAIDSPVSLETVRGVGFVLR